MFNELSQSRDSQSDYSQPKINIHKRLLSPFQKKLLQEKLQTNLRPEYRRRIEIMLLADRGCSQTKICATLNCSHETARYWTRVAQAGDAHKWQELPIGRPKTVNERYLNRLQELVSQNPQDFGYAFNRWTAYWLSKHLAEELGIQVSERHVNRLLKKMGLSTRRSRLDVDMDSSSIHHFQELNSLKSQNSNIIIGNLKGSKPAQIASFSPFQLT
ncbi:helix-turn-helix domain-containing protein [Pleurocapsa sp. PCC 7319]|uniref:helix-turn-helix domain-containing protein n=1 Tax=Pleurocapsa sp. PCC 7319 TaxID=118161 RepID=UPI00034D933C|nr:helix-turn-helix domain-containing protein [Pleurocapsa sp. PCC 7319]